MKNNTTNDPSDLIIGYSAFEFSEECYEYNENACYVADRPETLKQFLINAMFNVKDYRIDPVKLSDIINDFGCSCGEYAFEPKALDRFEKAAKALGMDYSVEPYDDIFNEQPSLFIVNVGYKIKFK